MPGFRYTPGMRIPIVWAILVTSLPLCCKSQGSRRSPEAGAAAPASSARTTPQRFGAVIKPVQGAELGRVLANPGEFQGKTLVVEGQVRRACSRKGCWMELATSNEASAPGCRVTFKDYGFFVPKDSSGSSARVEAVVEVADLEPSYVSHMEQEGARFASKNPDGSAREVRLVAQGVELWR